jgi:hypothetical protein
LLTGRGVLDPPRAGLGQTHLLCVSEGMLSNGNHASSVQRVRSRNYEVREELVQARRGIKRRDRKWGGIERGKSPVRGRVLSVERRGNAGASEREKRRKKREERLGLVLGRRI